MIARVAIEIATDKLFDYLIPPPLQPSLQVGQRVEVPFGHRTTPAIVIELFPHAQATAPKDNQPPPQPELLHIPPQAPQLKSLRAIIPPTPFISPKLIELARWIAAYYCAPLSLTLRCMLPAAIRKRNAKPKTRQYLTPLEGDFNLTARQNELLTHLRRVKGGWLHDLTREFNCATATLKALADQGAASLELRQTRRDPLARRTIIPTQAMRLMPEQQEALTIILSQLNRQPATAPQASLAPPRPVLLFGVTGSGKTEVYLQAIARALELNQGSIVLVPEIALTPQTVQRFVARFGDRIAVLHSALSDGERFDEWHRINNGSAHVVIGPRSALFAPVQNLGLIIVDEEHEPSYKQDETPRYNARDVAVMRGWLEKCSVVLGSATPSMESWLNVQKNKYILATIAKRVSGRPMPQVDVVDMRRETARTGFAQIFSADLLEALRLRLERGEQSILFINRRGYSTALQCPQCGYVAECQACDIAYTFHQYDTCLRCHICGGWQLVPPTCPGCDDPNFKLSGFGTQRVEQALQKCFPQARILRMDADVTKRKHSHDELLSIFKSGRADIMIGTQMIAKGLDFPNVTLVGVLTADTSLHMPDFRAPERTFQLLAQVSGRAGRAELPGQVFIQTYSPDHFAIRAAAGQNVFQTFAKEELKERQEGHYPPFAHLVCLTFRGTSEEKVNLTCTTFAENFTRHYGQSNIIISEPSPAPMAKVKGYYRYQIILRAVLTRTITRALQNFLPRMPLPGDVSLTIDVDAINMM